METVTQFKILAEHQYEDVFSPELVDFLTALHENFNVKRRRLLDQRKLKQIDFDLGQKPKFPEETLEIRNGN